MLWSTVTKDIILVKKDKKVVLTKEQKKFFRTKIKEEMGEIVRYFGDTKIITNVAEYKATINKELGIFELENESFWRAFVLE